MELVLWLWILFWDFGVSSGTVELVSGCGVSSGTVELILGLWRYSGGGSGILIVD